MQKRQQRRINYRLKMFKKKKKTGMRFLKKLFDVFIVRNSLLTLNIS